MYVLIPLGLQERSQAKNFLFSLEICSFAESRQSKLNKSLALIPTLLTPLKLRAL